MATDGVFGGGEATGTIVMAGIVTGAVGSVEKTEKGTMMVVTKPLMVTGTTSPEGPAYGVAGAPMVVMSVAAGCVTKTVVIEAPMMVVTTSAGSVTVTV